MDYRGIAVNRYVATFGDMSTDPKLKCYCPTNDTCWKHGLHDLTKCVGAPIVASMPHFYDADPMYVNGVRGLHPNEEDHGIVLVFELVRNYLFIKRHFEASKAFAHLALEA